MYQKSLIFIIAILCSFAVSAQNLSWKKLRNRAEASLSQGNVKEAAADFEAAWQKKQSKKELIFKAGECYYTISDYRKAATAYEIVKDENDTYPLVGLKYARSLKQDAQYQKAKAAFQDFLDAYSGQGRTILEDIIRKEVMGCDLAAKLPLSADRSIELKAAGPNINSEGNEFSPFFADGQLFLSSDKSGKARVLSSRVYGGIWDNAGSPSNFPLINNEHYVNASLSPDGEKMYFNICSANNKWNELKSRCEIFEMEKTSSGWTKPKRLPDYINLNGVSAIHPKVYYEDGKEVLLYASNRDGGRGGMDIWYATRDLSAAEEEFSFPINLGPTVNSIGDEISPFYDVEDKLLYFASNGHVSIGGFDIFKAQGAETSWTNPQNAGIPYNTSADDYGFYLDKDKTAGFLVSNRVFGGEKITTTDTDIFYYDLGFGSQNIVVRGSVYDKLSGGEIKNFKIELYQVQSGGQETLLLKKDFSNGGYELDVLADRTFKVIILSDGYEPKSYQFTTNDPNVTFYGQPVYLEDQNAISSSTGNFTPDNSGFKPTTTTKPAGNVKYTSRGTSPTDNFEYITSAPRHSGTYYKVQLAAVSKFNPKNTLYQQMSEYGRFDTEKLLNRNLTRVLIADFFDKNDAFRIMTLAKQTGFNAAFVVKYENGVRYGRIKN